ncbi:hypothetical protein STRNTR1_0587 [Stenotrophomonas maltophilia]|nr:hypothetical protein STRNTR1_0587 [Stenotrophomonas maltophilia]
MVLELTQGRGVLGHGEGSVRKGHTHGHKPPVGGLRGAPLSFCLRVWKRGKPRLRAPSAPDRTGLSRVVLRVVSGLSDYGRCAFGSGVPLLPPCCPPIIARRGRASRLRARARRLNGRWPVRAFCALLHGIRRNPHL